ncbi:Tim44 domain-containing protein [Acetobacteraceae bacterium]|nr:Tim44 domain-containing protein [Acetobacteraceae bacterium]
MNYLNHIPWDIVSLAVAVIVVGVLLYLFVGKRVGIQVWKSSTNASIQIGKQVTPTPPPLPTHASLPKDPTQYFMPELGSEGAASIARAAEQQAGFSAEALLKDIEKHYRNIMEAYDARQIEKLEPLLGKEAMQAFAKELALRAERKEVVFSHVSSIESMKIIRIIFPPELPLEEESFSHKRVEVEISSWQINGAKEDSGHLVFGTQGLTHFSEKWLFEESGSVWRAIAVESV